MNSHIHLRTVSLISKIIKPWVEEGVVSVPESREIIAQLRNLAQKGKELPMVVPKLVDQKEAAQMIGIGLSNFKKLEGQGGFPFKRRMVGTSVRYRNTDLVKFILSSEED